MLAVVLLAVTYVLRTIVAGTTAMPMLYGGFEVGKMVSLGPRAGSEEFGPPIPTWVGM